MQHFTPEQRLAGQKASAEAKVARRHETARRQEAVAEIVDFSTREEIPIAALMGTLALMRRITTASEDVELVTALDLQRAAEAASILHKLGRLEMGESTSNVATAAIDPVLLAARLARVTDGGPTST